MIINYGNLIIDIKAKREAADNDFNDIDAGFFMNQVSLMAENAALIARIRKQDALAEDYDAKSDEVYRQLMYLNFYEEVGATC